MLQLLPGGFWSCCVEQRCAGRCWCPGWVHGVQTLHLVKAMPSAVVEPEVMFLGAMALTLLLLLPESPDLSLSHL